MKKYKTTNNQTWFDIAFQLFGDFARAAYLAFINGSNLNRRPTRFIEVPDEADTSTSNVSSGGDLLTGLGAFSEDFNQDFNTTYPRIEDEL